MKNVYSQLFERKLITDNQYGFLDAIKRGTIISVYYELRLILYLGIMLFTGGVGYFAYENMGSLGHILAMMLIGVGAGVCFYFVRKFALPYSNNQVVINHPFFEYILLLEALLLISLFVYFIVYFNLVSEMINFTSIISAAILLFMAYRYDNIALLSMGITALAAAMGISISPVNWAEGNLFSYHQLYLICMVLGAALVVAGEVSYRKDIKKHFRFTYQNFGLILYFIGSVSAVFVSYNEVFFAFLLLASAVAVLLHSWRNKAFLFFLYSNIAAYIAITYMLFKIISVIGNDGFMLLVYYFPISCILYIIFLANKKSHFAND